MSHPAGSGDGDGTAGDRADGGRSSVEAAAPLAPRNPVRRPHPWRRLVARLLDHRRAIGGQALPDRFRIERDDLLARCTREEIEAREVAVDPLGGAPAVPFGHLNPAWQRFVRTLQHDDELWRFQAHRMAFDGAGEVSSGYVVVRGGRPCQAMVASVRSLPAGPAIDRSSPGLGAETASARARRPATVE